MAEVVECVLYEEIDLSPVVQPEITVVQTETLPTIIQHHLQAEVPMVQMETLPTIIQPHLQAEVPMVQMETLPTIIQPHLQQTAVAAVIQPEAQPAVTVVQPAPVSAVVQPVVHQTSPVVSQPTLRDIPGQFKCVHCHLDIITVTRYMADTTVACSMFGSNCTFNVCPCCLVPFRSCTDVEHSCPNCRNVVYIFKRHS